ncbi:MAG: TonB-dependent receptor plug domain-containing protein [Bacteroidetes bacterium]|nr:TonB-dependent receptor plug domain-containing protein [Bacteroidota bacterium]
MYCNLEQVRSMRYILLMAICLASATGYAQSPLTVRVRDVVTHEVLEGAAVTVDSLTGMTDSSGLIQFPSVAAGMHEIHVSMVGYFKKKMTVYAPRPAGDTATIGLSTSQEEMDEVVVVSTRTQQKVDDLPTRVEVIGQDEVEERSTDKPSDISHAVKEQPGVQIQRTSASSGTFNIRLQGLRGKYVQILKDGFPLFGGLSQNLSIAQIPPMDLKQIEIIKGPASTLYGGDAIAGVINLIAKEPSETPEFNVLYNVENTRSQDAAAYASQKVKWFGYSLITQFRDQRAFDWDHDHFSDVPQLRRWSISPQLYFDLTRKAKLQIGFNYAWEKRRGGAMQAIAGQQDSTYDYLENNLSYRYGSNFRFQYDLGDKGNIVVRNSINYFDRQLTIFDYGFGGRQFSTVSEAHYHRHIGKHDIVVGMDFKTDGFHENDTATVRRDYYYMTGGLFVQEEFKVTKTTTLEGGLRLDYNQKRGPLVLPHFAWKQQWNEIFRTRFNFGMGYKLPTVFQDESEEANYRHVLPIGDSVRAEISAGGTFDLAVKPALKNGWSFEFNELFFFTRILHPLVADTTGVHLSFHNGNGYIQAAGMETSFKLGYRGASLFFTYTLQDQNQKINDVRSISPLTSKHIVSILASYTWRNRFMLGLDAYYYSSQYLSDGTATHPIWEMGMNAQVIFRWFNVFVNFENILNIRQTSYGPVVFADPTFHTPRFNEVYAPLEGRVLNVGFKVKLAEFFKKKSVSKTD